MGMLIAAAAAALLLVTVVLALLLRKLLSPSQPPALDPAWWMSFSVEKYRPAERLFSADDYEFLARQPGFTPRLARRLRAQRRKVFRQYLRCLSRDFDRLYAVARQLLLDSSSDRPELARALVWQWVLFHLGLALVHGRLLLQWLGLGTVDVRGLVSAAEAMRERLFALRAAPAAVPVYRD